MTEIISPDYQPRINLLKLKIAECLTFYGEPPSHADQLSYVEKIAEIMNKEFSAPLELNVMSNQVDEAIQILMSSFKANTWPRPAHFVEACKERARRAAERNLTLSASQEEKNEEAEARRRGDIDWLAFNSGNTQIREACQLLSRKWIDNDHRIWTTKLGKPDGSVRSRLERGDLTRPDRDGVMALISAQEI